MRLVRLIVALVALATASHPIVVAGAPAAPGARVPLLDQDGRAFTLRDLAGRSILLTFVATRCTDACPLANGAFRLLQRELDRRHDTALLLTVTLDPQHDTPFVMARAARDLGARAARWRLASGSVTNVERLLRAFGVVVQPDANGIPDVHSTFVYLLGRDGRLRRTMLLASDFPAQALRVLADRP